MKNLSSLSYLQYKILETIYLSLEKNKEITIENLASSTFYKKESKILVNALNAVINKGLVEGGLEQGFNIPKEKIEILELVKKRNLISTPKYKSSLKSFEELNNYDFSNTTNLLGELDNWYSYVEEFSSEIIYEKINNEKLNKNAIIFDPFIGSGTTSIVANICGFDSIGIDANPLMTKVSQVKTNWNLNEKNIYKKLIEIKDSFIKNIKDEISQDEIIDTFSNMPDKELSQWLSQKNIKEIVVLKKIILKVQNIELRNFFLICLSKSAFDTSYVALCPGTTFYPLRNKNEFWDEFCLKVEEKIKHLGYIKSNYSLGNSNFINDNCLNVSNYIKPNTIDFAITSPPYPNDLEYTRQTRLELYLLNFVNSMDDVSKIKKNMVKSSTKLIYKESNSEFAIKDNKKVQSLSENIFEKTKNKNWGWDYPRMVREYFGDMKLCLIETKKILKKNSKFMLVCGDQTIQGVYLPVCDILVEMAYELGYSNAYKEPYRVRRSTSHKIDLPEDIVVLTK